MSARKIKSSWWVDFYFQGARHRVRSPENSKDGAQAFEALLRHRLARGKGIKGRKHAADFKTFEEASKKWFETYVETNTKLSTQQGYASALRVHFLPRFGARNLKDITEYEIENFKRELLRKGISPKSINNFLSILRKLLESCREWGWLKRIPRVKWLKVPPPGFDFLSPDESQHLLDSNTESVWYDMILCALRTGMRLGELLGLRWEDVDFKRRQISVRRSRVRGRESTPKNNRVRHIPMSDQLFQVLTRRTRHSDVVFSVEPGRVPTNRTAGTGLKKALQKAEMRHIGWHVLRHTFASQLASQGVPIVVIQSLLGHSTVQMTMRYAHLSQAAQMTAISTLDEATSGRSRQHLGNIWATGQPVRRITVRKSA